MEKTILMTVAIMTINFSHRKIDSGPWFCFIDSSVAERLGKVAELIYISVPAEA